MDGTSIIVAGLTGLGAGAIGSLGAPWAAWGVEKRREERTHRRQLISTWRTMVARRYQDESLDSSILDDPDFLSLRAQMDQQLLEELETAGYSVHFREGAQGILARWDLNVVASEIDKIEKKWKLE
ncbi:MAG: hypothetical protein ACR2HV_10660 [Acidimicrobiales bacterium]